MVWEFILGAGVMGKKGGGEGKKGGPSRGNGGGQQGRWSRVERKSFVKEEIGLSGGEQEKGKKGGRGMSGF